MPRNGSGVYSLPPNSTFTPNTLIQSSVVNGINNDIATDLNTPRPIFAGGTGGTTVATALANLGVSAFSQTVLATTSGSTMFATMGAVQSSATNGYAILPGGAKFMWGRNAVTTTANGDFTILFPTSFSSFRQITAMNGDYSVGGAMSFAENISAGQPGSGFNARAYAGTAPIVSSGIWVAWHALGV